MGGAVVGRRDALEALNLEAMVHYGGVLSPFNAWLILRGAATFPASMVRYEQRVRTLNAFLSDIYGATPCNLVGKLIDPGHVEAVAGVNLPMLVRALTYRTKDLQTMIRKAVSGGCEGVLHMAAESLYASARG